ncbi:histidine phosphatase family protein [Chitinophaga varians]|uniref:Histidine phosphatase family protein n=2 Tax=Chitinophaga TaxID=79328 RepID=A0A847RFS8_9BACT|nr:MULTISPECIES: histidine phosphatase family protein [Chitinophaga]MBC9911021.1 histidine phosphatase family protein [Chitinophaga varians]NLR64860.1 histidine phosphatase family protein [Chitinophaga varians]NML36264.1 histidine phosphatase family protein [Chitinophaga fulva]
MKTLLLIRHAKSSWTNPDMDDFDRPLNKRGKQNAPEMAQRLVSRGMVPELIIASPAKRARTTAKIMAEEWHYPKQAILLEEELYLCYASTFLKVITKIDDDFNAVAIFAHNPGITDFANYLTEEIRIDNVPTTGIFAIQADTDSWKDFDLARKKFLFFDYPRNN